MLAARIGVIAAGTVAAGEIALAVATIICAIVDEVDVVLVAMPFMPGMLAISVLAVVPSHSLNRRSLFDDRLVCLKMLFYTGALEPKRQFLGMQDIDSFKRSTEM